LNARGLLLNLFNKLCVAILALGIFIMGPLSAEQNADLSVSNDQDLTRMFAILGSAALLFYFMMWKPEKKRQRELETQRENIKIGDRIMVAGIIGTVSLIKEDTLIMKMYDGNQIEVLKKAIVDIQSPAIVDQLVAKAST
jgi:preprotein translocase subunit YajC